jgi:hypothetical protein
MRPEKKAEFQDDVGERWTGIGWHTRKFEVFQDLIGVSLMDASLVDVLLTGAIS